MHFDPSCKNPKRRPRRNKAKHDEEFVRTAKKFEKLKKQNPDTPDFADPGFRKIEKEKIAKLEKFKKRKFEKLKISISRITLSEIKRKAKELK